MFECEAVAESPSEVPFDARDELVETQWKKDGGLGTRFLCLAGIEIICFAIAENVKDIESFFTENW